MKIEPDPARPPDPLAPEPGDFVINLRDRTANTAYLVWSRSVSVGDWTLDLVSPTGDRPTHLPSRDFILALPATVLDSGWTAEKIRAFFSSGAAGASEDAKNHALNLFEQAAAERRAKTPPDTDPLPTYDLREATHVFRRFPSGATRDTSEGKTDMSTADPMATVHQYIAAFNKGDSDGMAAVFAVPGSILDRMAPYVWLGPAATRDWYRDVLAEAEHHGASGYVVTLGEPRHVDVTGDAAYVVAPATVGFQLRGKPVKQSGAVFITVALRMEADGWRIASWAWAKGTQ